MGLEMLQWPAAVIALAGAWMVGARTPRGRQIGFVCFLIANLMWCCVAIATGVWALLVMQAAFIVTSARGVISNREGNQK